VEDAIAERAPIVTTAPAETFAALYERTFPKVYAYVASLLRDRAAAEDVTAQAFERAYRKRRGYRPGRGSMDAWIFGIARNAALDELRRRQRAAAAELPVPPPAAEVTVRPRDGQPGEQLLEHAAQQILACADRPGDARRKAYGLGDVIGALEAAGALSPFSPVPGYLATVCERLGIEGHAITAAPTAALPGPWLSLLAWYGRRHRPPVHGGTAAVGTVLPDVDGARIAVAGLHTRGDQTLLHVVAGRDRPGRVAVDAGPLSHPGFCCWLRDDGGQWHVAVPGSWSSDGHGEVTGSLQVLPPLGRDTSRITLLASTLTSQVRAEVPLRWWAAP